MAADLLAVLRPYARARGLRVIDEFNLGEGPADYRVPDGGLIREPLGGETLVADPTRRQVTVFQRAGDGYQPIERSPALGIPAAEMTEAVDWP